MYKNHFFFFILLLFAFLKKKNNISRAISADDDGNTLNVFFFRNNIDKIKICGKLTDINIILKNAIGILYDIQIKKKWTDKTS